MGKKPIVSVSYENERINDFNKKQLTLHKMCVTSLLGDPWEDFWPLGCTVNGFLSPVI